MRLNCPNGLTIRELKKYLEDLPETDSRGIEHEVWLDPHPKRSYKRNPGIDELMREGV